MASKKPVMSSPEHMTMVQSTNTLISTVKEDISEVGNALISKEYIPPSLRETLRLETLEPSKKAEKIVDRMTDLVDGDPAVYHEFVDILASQGKWTSDCVEELKECFEANSKKLTVAVNQPGEKPTGPSFVCRTCQKCTIEEFLKNGCPKASPTKPVGKKDVAFPYLDTSALSQKDKELLECTLMSDFEKIRDSFLDFQLSIMRSLSKSDIASLKEMIVFLLGHKEIFTEEEVAELKAATSMADVFVALHDHMSFFNFEILERMVTKFGSTEDNKKLHDYATSFSSYCKRNVFEVPSNIFHPQIADNGCRFTVKLMIEKPVPLEKVKKVCRKIAKILNIPTWELRLLSIEKGCIEMRFAVPQMVLPISPTQRKALRKIGLRILSKDHQMTLRVFLLQKICHQLDPNNVKELVYTQTVLPPTYLGKSALEVLLKLEMLDMFSVDKLAPLSHMMKTIGRKDLAKKVDQFGKKLLKNPSAKEHSNSSTDVDTNLEILKLQFKILQEQLEELIDKKNVSENNGLKQSLTEAAEILEDQLQPKIKEAQSRQLALCRQQDTGSISSIDSISSLPPSSLSSSEDWMEIRSPVATLERQHKDTQNGKKTNSLPRVFKRSQSPKARIPFLPPSQKKPVDDDYEEIGPPTTNPTLFARPPPMPSLYYSAVDVTRENRSDSNKGQLVTGRDGVRAKLPPPTAPKAKTSPSVSDLSGGSDFTGGSIDTSTGDSGFVDTIRYRKKTPGQKKIKPRHYTPLKSEQRDKLGYYKTARPEDNPTLAGVFELLGEVPEESPYVNLPHKTHK